MATDAKKLQPIIIKRVKKGGHATHGGAWKIAYADFVTAMMAFFLLMWLLGSTSEGDKKGISDYFQSPLKVAMQGGSGAGSQARPADYRGAPVSRVQESEFFDDRTLGFVALDATREALELRFIDAENRVLFRTTLPARTRN